ncbi:profilin, required for normal timing of actin polymerization in response to thermal stress [Boothiomyces sp. JEL0866]|nr:profilin, required for normal timing of actin polymerization in response to thermal stress [Boothiomyces sp. JEL0866]
MSWQAYVDTNLVGTGKIARAAIYGHDGSLWATSKGFNVSSTEIQGILAAFKDATAIRANGLLVGGIKHIAIRADERSVYGKKGTGGVCCVKTKQAILIAMYEEPVQFGEATKVVEALADYLISVNY